VLLRFDVALSEGNVHRRRPGEERKDGEVLRTNRLQRGWYCRYDIYGMRQRLRNDWLNDNVGSVAKGTIGLKYLTVGMHVPNLHDRGADNECTTEEAKRCPERRMCSLIETAT
jgi:hypothetical protein